MPENEELKRSGRTGKRRNALVPGSNAYQNAMQREGREQDTVTSNSALSSLANQRGDSSSQGDSNLGNAMKEKSNGIIHGGKDKTRKGSSGTIANQWKTLLNDFYAKSEPYYQSLGQEGENQKSVDVWQAILEAIESADPEAATQWKQNPAELNTSFMAFISSQEASSPLGKNFISALKTSMDQIISSRPQTGETPQTKLTAFGEEAGGENSNIQQLYGQYHSKDKTGKEAKKVSDTSVFQTFDALAVGWMNIKGKKADAFFKDSTSWLKLSESAWEKIKALKKYSDFTNQFHWSLFGNSPFETRRNLQDFMDSAKVEQAGYPPNFVTLLAIDYLTILDKKIKTDKSFKRLSDAEKETLEQTDVRSSVNNVEASVREKMKISEEKEKARYQYERTEGRAYQAAEKGEREKEEQASAEKKRKDRNDRKSWDAFWAKAGTLDKVESLEDHYGTMHLNLCSLWRDVIIHHVSELPDTAGIALKSMISQRGVKITQRSNVDQFNSYMEESFEKRLSTALDSDYQVKRVVQCILDSPQKEFFQSQVRKLADKKAIQAKNNEKMMESLHA